MDQCEVSMMIPFNPTEPWSGSIIGSKLDTGIELMAHIALTSLCEDHLAATVALPIVLLPIQNQENPIWQQRLEAVSDLKGPHFHAGRVFSTDLIILKGQGLDVILGMSWMKLQIVVLDIAGWLVHLDSPMYSMVILHLPAIPHIKASLHHMVELKLEDIHVVREFSDVFPDDLPRMPPERAIEFKIELQPGTTLIAKAPYKMSPMKMKELKIQL
jgi:hypothetical protein